MSHWRRPIHGTEAELVRTVVVAVAVGALLAGGLALVVLR
jgi:hypothetical protein